MRVRMVSVPRCPSETIATSRALNRSQNLHAAIAFDTGYAAGNSNWACTQHDNALAGLIAINQRAFSGAISAGQKDGGAEGYEPLDPLPPGWGSNTRQYSRASWRPALAPAC